MPSGILAFGAFFNALGGASMRTNLVVQPCSSPEACFRGSSPYSARTRQHALHRLSQHPRRILSNISLAVRVCFAVPCVGNTSFPSTFPRQRHLPGVHDDDDVPARPIPNTSAYPSPARARETRRQSTDDLARVPKHARTLEVRDVSRQRARRRSPRAREGT